MEEWYYGKNGQQQGPVDLEQIRSLLASGQLSPTDLVWKEGMANWTAIGQIPELTPHTPVTGNFGQGGQGGYQGGGYQGNQGGFGTVQSPGDPTKNGMAMTSMILGIIALAGGCFCFGILGFGCGIPAIITSRSGMQSQQPGMAKAGLICGIIGIVFGVISLIINILMLAGTITNPYQNGFNFN